jgi:hypothetical protein
VRLDRAHGAARMLGGMPAPAERCAWLLEDGTMCDAPLPDDELFCTAHPGGPRRSTTTQVIATAPTPVPARRGRPPAVAVLPAAGFRPSGEPGRLESVYRASLVQFGQEETPDGQLCLFLCQHLDAGLSPSALAAVTVQLRAVADKIFAGRPPTADRLDELTARRQSRVQDG